MEFPRNVQSLDMCGVSAYLRSLRRSSLKSLNGSSESLKLNPVTASFGAKGYKYPSTSFIYLSST
jgi:hypothetical protein